MKKIISIDEWLKIESQLIEKKIVFTNGCFDILHAGHVLYLQEAKALGDILIVGLNSDSSVKRLKGKERPIHSEEERAIVLAGLESTDYIIIFHEDTPYNLIKQIQPDVLVKGGDWTSDSIVGADIVREKKGLVTSLSFKKGCSTTTIIDKIKKMNG